MKIVLIITKISRYASNDEEDINNIIQCYNIDKNLLYELTNDTINVSVAINKNDALLKLFWIMEKFE